MRAWTVGMLAVAAGLTVVVSGQTPTPAAQSPTPAPAQTATPAQTAAQAEIAALSKQDHQRQLDLLKIPSLRPGASGNAQASNAANTDESKATQYQRLPDPLTFKNGKKVNTAAQWRARRAEIVEDFDREVYGRAPKQTPAVKWEVTDTTKDVNGDVPIVTKKLIGHVDNSAYPAVTVDIELTLTTPANAIGPVPVVMELTFPRRPPVAAPASTPAPAAGSAGSGSGSGIGPGTAAPAPAPGQPAPPPAPAATPGPTWQHQVLAKGWGYAQIVPVSIQADNGAGLTKGIIGLVNKGQPRSLEDWGALRAWAWGASRALDYFETDKAVDAKHVAIEGHSRYGKAALVAMAYDVRFATGFISSSGAGGAKVYRRDFGEKVENVAGTGEYHWMAGNFVKYAGPLTANDLPVDAHELVALCAPRPVFISSGSFNGDSWVDPKGMFLAGVGAGPVYTLLGKKPLAASEFPPIETLIDGDIAYRQHAGGHTPGPNWPTFLTFASRYFGGGAAMTNRSAAR